MAMSRSQEGYMAHLTSKRVHLMQNAADKFSWQYFTESPFGPYVGHCGLTDGLIWLDVISAEESTGGFT